MLSGLEHLNEETKKRHLFLLSGDTENHFKVFTSMPLYVSLGGQGMSSQYTKEGSSF
jgi:hypothetical protein